MATQLSTGSNSQRNPPSGYRSVPTPGDQPNAWVHEQTGLAVELYRYARFYRQEDALPDHYHYDLIVRPTGSNGKGFVVDGMNDGFDNEPNERQPVDMAREWMDAHPDGRVDLEAEVR